MQELQSIPYVTSCSKSTGGTCKSTTRDSHTRHHPHVGRYDTTDPLFLLPFECSNVSENETGRTIEKVCFNQHKDNGIHNLTTRKPKLRRLVMAFSTSSSSSSSSSDLLRTKNHKSSSSITAFIAFIADTSPH